MIPLADLRALYHRGYFDSDCEGHREFARTHGARLTRRLRKVLSLARAAPGERFLDAGCGRGELAAHLAAAGAHVIALDVSRDALRYAAEAFITPARPILARVESLPLASGSLDGILFSDVIEHMPAAAQQRALAEFRRVLRPGGRLIIHTQPNRILMDYTIPALSRVSRLWGVRLPRDLRAELGEGARGSYHVREMSLGDLRRGLRDAGFTIDELWLEGSYPIHRIFGDTRLKHLVLKRFYRSSALKQLFASQLFAVATGSSASPSRARAASHPPASRS